MLIKEILKDLLLLQYKPYREVLDLEEGLLMPNVFFLVL